MEMKMNARKPGRQRQAEFRRSLRSRGLREVKTWVPEQILQVVAKSVSEGRFESQAAAYAHAIERTFSREIKSEM
jgi:hypothetical protein